MRVTKYQQTQEINKLTFYCVLGLEVDDSAQVIPLHSLHHFQPPLLTAWLLACITIPSLFTSVHDSCKLVQRA